MQRYGYRDLFQKGFMWTKWEEALSNFEYLFPKLRVSNFLKYKSCIWTLCDFTELICAMRNYPSFLN